MVRRIAAPSPSVGVCIAGDGVYGVAEESLKAWKDVEEHRIVRRLRDGELRHVVVLAGAGLSVGAGIPDFRSPGTGLYDNLQKYGLPRPEAVFTLDYFRKNPEPFTMLANELWPCSERRPTLGHCFVRLLETRGLLQRHYTQNIDGLDKQAGISEERLVEAHGSFSAGHCIDCKQACKEERLREQVSRGEISRCYACGGLMKPNIVFFGEDLPEKFHKCAQQDLRACDLVICIGTSLQVEPFASLVHRARPHVPRILINREVPASFRRRSGDLVLVGDCDEQVRFLASVLGWEEELLSLERGRPSPKAVATAARRAAALEDFLGASCSAEARQRWQGLGLVSLLIVVNMANVFVQQRAGGLDSMTFLGMAFWSLLVAGIAAQTIMK